MIRMVKGAGKDSVMLMRLPAHSGLKQQVEVTKWLVPLIPTTEKINIQHVPKSPLPRLYIPGKHLFTANHHYKVTIVQIVVYPVQYTFHI